MIQWYPDSTQEYILYPGNIERAIRDYVTAELRRDDDHREDAPYFNSITAMLT